MYITITSFNNMHGEKALKIEGIVKLVKEPDNVDDTDAIAVYLDDDQVGYVSNIPLTNSPFSSMACELKDLPDECRGQYLLQYGRRYHIARIFRHER